MKRLDKLVVHTSLTLLLVAAPAALVADHGPGFGRGPGGRFGGLMADLIAERLDLSGEQRERIREIREGHREEAGSLMETIEDARIELRDSIHSEPLDEAAIRAAAARVASFEADLAVVRGRMWSDIREVLTPEQIVEAEALRDRMRGGGHGRHGRWGRQGR